MRIVVFDETDDVAFSYDTRRDTLALCPGRVEKAHVIEALQEAAFFIMDSPAPSPEDRNFRQHMYEPADRWPRSLRRGQGSRRRLSRIVRLLDGRDVLILKPIGRSRSSSCRLSRAAKNARLRAE